MTVHRRTSPQPFSTAEAVQDLVAAMSTGDVAGIWIDYDDAIGKFNFYTQVEFLLDISRDETTTLTTGVPKYTFIAPYNFEITDLRASLSTASTSGLVTVDVNDGAASVMAVSKLSIDANELTSVTAAAPRVITDSIIQEGAVVTVDVDAAGTGAKGLKVWIVAKRLVDVPPEAPVFTVGPAITGTPAGGQTLTSSYTASGDAPITAAYRWRLRLS